MRLKMASDDDVRMWLSMGGFAYASPNGTVVYNNSGTITDSRGAQWTVKNGVVLKNGKTIGFTSGTDELVYRNGRFTVYNAEPPSSSWILDENSTVWSSSTWPQPVTDKLSFWGMNGHFWGGTAYSKDAQTALKLVAAGCNTYRVGCAAGDTPRFVQFISAYAAPAHIAVYPVALISGAADESSGYAAGYSMGVEMSAMKGYVPIYEYPNEYASVSLNGGANGNLRSDYDPALYKMSRGIFRGWRDGILSRDPGAKFMGPTDTWLHYGFGDMLWNGTSPDNASANPALQVRWDITSWHWYDNMGDIEAAGGITANVLAALASYGKPIRINEYGCYASSFSDEAAITAYLTGPQLMGKWDSKRATYNITGCDSYELYDDGRAGDEGQFGIVLADATTNKTTRFSAFAAFIVSKYVYP
jgi:hypothetical protein